MGQARAAAQPRQVLQGERPDPSRPAHAAQRLLPVQKRQSRDRSTLRHVQGRVSRRDGLDQHRPLQEDGNPHPWADRQVDVRGSLGDRPEAQEEEQGHPVDPRHRGQLQLDRPARHGAAGVDREEPLPEGLLTHQPDQEPGCDGRVPLLLPLLAAQARPRARESESKRLVGTGLRQRRDRDDPVRLLVPWADHGFGRADRQELPVGARTQLEARQALRSDHHGDGVGHQRTDQESRCGLGALRVVHGRQARPRPRRYRLGRPRPAIALRPAAGEDRGAAEGEEDTAP